MGAMFGRLPHEVLDVDPALFAVDVAGYRHAREQWVEDQKAIWGG